MEQQFNVGDMVRVDYDSEYFLSELNSLPKRRPKYLFVKQIHNIQEKSLTGSVWNNAENVLGLCESMDIYESFYQNIPANLCCKVDPDRKSAHKNTKKRSW